MSSPVRWRAALPLERQAQRRELLAELIVEVAGDARALVFLRGDQPAAGHDHAPARCALRALPELRAFDAPVPRARRAPAFS